MTLRAHLSGLLLLALAACGGGSSGGPGRPAAPPSLTYRDPAPTGFRLEADPATQGTSTLVLRLVGPAGTALRGVTLFLETDEARAGWGDVPGTSQRFLNHGPLEPGVDPPSLARGYRRGGRLQVGVFHREGASPVLGAGPLLSVALAARAGAAPGPLALRHTRAALFVDGARHIVEVPVALGTVTAR
ncbi:hypothetical protein [Mesoterricola sediminis]|uniref:Lipoprotein n=1 Tax=Mesoterricola sediminis TaxID=2927980 RepID=A0AA48GQ39_9BACT|nr:hypothetical protein [Mesoterricola sediminis]BDU75507.1 hypothetical protein METESE_04650 [Mesoterricola sediminis]